ncbi:hypothetical protein E4U42_007433 [Claviceps africana]|uniref:Uncharacterized protein n=1 Tax=Claviceps africana TaxID=83212 RepID=A0A8K0NL28_9HYPO|nr:hypothetical protein E4U42_007433 [Claviceps africana]
MQFSTATLAAVAAIFAGQTLAGSCYDANTNDYRYEGACKWSLNNGFTCGDAAVGSIADTYIFKTTNTAYAVWAVCQLPGGKVNQVTKYCDAQSSTNFWLPCVGGVFSIVYLSKF